MDDRTAETFLDRDKNLRLIKSGLESLDWIEEVEIKSPEYEPAGFNGIAYGDDKTQHVVGERSTEALESYAEQAKHELADKIFSEGLEHFDNIKVAVTARHGAPQPKYGIYFLAKRKVKQ